MSKVIKYQPLLNDTSELVRDLTLVGVPKRTAVSYNSQLSYIEEVLVCITLYSSLLVLTVG